MATDFQGRRRPGSLSKSMKNWSLDSLAPPVCSVHPGRTLELSTAIGLSKMRNSFNADAYLNTAAETLGGNLLGQRKSKLKSGRLQPLGLHVDPFLSSRTCLGVVSVDNQRRRFQRSSTAPAKRFASTRHSQQYVEWDQAGKTISNFRHAFSANPNMMFEINSRRLMQQEEKINDIQENSKDELNCSVSLPPVAPTNQQQLHIRIDVRRPLKTASKANTEVTINEEKADDNEDIDDTTVVINEQLKQQQHSKHRVRRVSGGNKGKLSHGWSSPKPLAPIRGLFPPVNTVKTKIDNHQNESPNEVNCSTNELLTKNRDTI